MDDLIKAIGSAFAKVEYPGDDNLTVFRPEGRKWDETWQALHGKAWQQFDPEEFMQGDTPIPDLTPEAFHYYLPALLIAGLHDSDVQFSVTHYLTPSSALNEHGPFPYDNRDEFAKKAALFSPEQRAVIVRVLRECCRIGWLDDGEVAEAVEFWSSEPGVRPNTV